MTLFGITGYSIPIYTKSYRYKYNMATHISWRFHVRSGRVRWYEGDVYNQHCMFENPRLFLSVSSCVNMACILVQTQL